MESSLPYLRIIVHGLHAQLIKEARDKRFRTRRPLGVNSGYLFSFVCKSTQHNVRIYSNLKANECTYVYIKVKVDILQQ